MATTQNYSWPSSSQVTITGIGNPTGQPVPSNAVYVAADDPSGNLHGLQVDAAGNLKVALAAEPLSPLLTSDAADGPVTPGTAATKSILTGLQFNTVLPTLASGQQAAAQADSSGRLLIGALSAGANNIGSITNITGTVSLPTGAATSALQTTANTSLASIVTNTADVANSTGVLGTAAPSDAMLMGVKNGANLVALTEGSATSANSIPVVIASDQVVPVSATALPLPTGASTAALQTQISGQLPTTLGAHVTAASLAVNIASDQVVPVSATTLPLPTGAATAALQSSVQGTVAAGTAATNSLLTGGVYNSTLPTLTTGQQAAAQLDASARRIVVPGTPAARTVTQAAITVGTSAVRLTVSGSAPAATRVALVADPDASSAAKFYIGSSTVTSSGSTRGVQIVAGQTFIANNDAGDYWIVSDTAAQTVYVMEQA